MTVERVGPSLRGAKRRSNPDWFRGYNSGLLRFARNDGERVGGRNEARRDDRHSSSHHVAEPLIVGWPSTFAVQSSMPPAPSLALTENSLPSNSGCTPR